MFVQMDKSKLNSVQV